MSTLPKTICMLPWTSIETTPMGTARPCCLAQDEITDATGKKFKLEETDLKTIYDSDYMVSLRKQFLNGEKPATCQRCWDEEAAGRTSKRKNSRIRLKELFAQVDWQNPRPDQLWFIDLKLGNICNLKCRICGSWSSSKWSEEEMKYTPDTPKKEHLAYFYLKAGAWPRQSNNFWDNLRSLLKNIQYFEFTGGEPWLIQEHIDLLKFAVQTGDSKHIDIHYNTNATVLPDDLYEVWQHFGRVDIAFSVDNTGERFEYERYGAKWKRANEIIDAVHLKRETAKNITTQLCFTVNIQNVYYIDELLKWAETKHFDTIYFNMLHGPECMSVQEMTPEAQQLVVDKLTELLAAPWAEQYRNDVYGVINFINNGKGSDGSDFRYRMKAADTHRNESFTALYPEMSRAMRYE